MSLFDDLLNQTKTTKTVSGSGSGQQDDTTTVTSATIDTPNQFILGVEDITPVSESPSESPMIIPLGTEDNSMIPSENPQEISTPNTTVEIAIEPSSDTNGFIVASDEEIAEIPSVIEDNTHDEGIIPTRFQDTESYLTHAINEVDTLIGNIDTNAEAKLAEKKEYEKQKIDFTKLELEAENEYKKMLEERAHAKKMKEYLENEREQANKPKKVSKEI